MQAFPEISEFPFGYRDAERTDRTFAHTGEYAHPSSLVSVLMRLVVDLNKCQGYAQCVPLAPEVLRLNGEEALAYDPNPDESQRQQVLRAVASCPVQAIILELDPPDDRDTL